MEASEAIFSRRTIHVFESKKVSEKIILEGVNAANQAPCHKLTFPWRFYSIGLDKRKEILSLAIELKSKDNKLNDKAINIIKDKYLNPSHLLVVSQILSNNKFTLKEDYAACSCAIQNLAISMASKGVSIKWSSGSITRNPKVYEIININATKEEIIGFIWVGYGKKPLKISRPSINEIFKQI